MPIRPEQFVILKRHLEQVYVTHLPKLLKPKSDQENLAKNIDRSFAAFAIDHICQLDPKKAARAVVDDFEDYGIDAIYYHPRTKTLYLVQAKLKETKSFNQDEALKFTHGVRKLVNGDYSGFNQHVLSRESQIRGYLDHCDHIEIVVAHTGEGLHVHAEKAIQELLLDKAGGEGRISDVVLDFDSARTVDGLHSVNAVEQVQCRIKLHNYGEANEPKIAYYGTVALSDLVDLHKKHGKALYQKNIRTWLGHKTPVNEAIQATLAANPARFQYLNNGVTALCEGIDAKVGIQTKHREFELTGFSIINGAQTVASSANFVGENPDADISEAKVMITLIRADAESDFGKEVTRARNRQNDVKDIAFAALDEEQERIRRELQHMDLEYVYRVGENPSGNDPKRIMVGEAILALAMMEEGPRYPIWMKQSLAEFQKTDGNQYRQIFSQSLSSFRLVNAVRVYRYVNARVDTLVRTNWYEEKAAYKHGRYALAFIFAKQLSDAINGSELVDTVKLNSAGSVPMDELRQKLWEVIQAEIAYCGPLKAFRNPNFGLPAITKIMTNHYGLVEDPVRKIKAAKWVFGEPYQIELFKHLAAKAPQIANVT